MRKESVEHYVLRIESYVGEHSARAQQLDSGAEAESVYAILRIGRDGAEIVDDGYVSWDEAKLAWPSAR